MRSGAKMYFFTAPRAARREGRKRRKPRGTRGLRHQHAGARAREGAAGTSGARGRARGGEGPCGSAALFDSNLKKRAEMCAGTSLNGMFGLVFVFFVNNIINIFQ